MTETKSHPKPESGFSGRIAIWVVVLLAVYLGYSATHFWGRPDAVADFLAMVARRLPVMVVQILPPAVFAGATLTVEDDRQDYGEADYWTPPDNANRTSSVRTA